MSDLYNRQFYKNIIIDIETYNTRAATAKITKTLVLSPFDTRLSNTFV